jgi:hypothetical protein
VAEGVAQQIIAGHNPAVKVGTTLTRANQRAGFARARARERSHHESQVAPAQPAPQGEELRARSPRSPIDASGHPGGRGRRDGVRLSPTCRACGRPVSDPDRRYCDGCLTERRSEQAREFAAAGQVAQAERRARGDDPSHGGAAAGKRGESLAAKASARKEWETAHPDVDLDAERERFAREILPRLQGVPIAKIARAAGISKTYAELIRQGAYTPHPLYFGRLVELLAADGNEYMRGTHDGKNSG